MASGGNEDEKEALCCLCFKQLNADDQALAIQCSAGHYICANDPRLVGGRCAASFVRSQTETSPMSYTPPIECPKCGAPVVWPTFLRFLEHDRLPRPTMMSPISGRVEPVTLASSNFRREHALKESPKLLHELFSSIHSFITLMCVQYKLPAAAGKDLFLRLQRESFENPQELLSEMQAAVTRIWTSTQKLQGAGVDDAFNVEFCCLLNRALRDDGADVMPHLVVIVRAISVLRIVRRESASLKFPPNAVSHRGGALPRQHHAFFTAGKKYRVPMYLATSFSEDKAYEFWCSSPSPSPSFPSAAPSHVCAGTAPSRRAICPCTGSSTSTPVGSRCCATAARM